MTTAFSFEQMWTLTNLGYVLLALGLIVTGFSKHRYLLAYMAAGMVYWLGVEGLQNLVVNVLPVGQWHGYVIALSLSWMVPGLYLVYRHFQTPVSKQRRQRQRFSKSRLQGKYIEHTPIYDNYKPKFNAEPNKTAQVASSA